MSDNITGKVVVITGVSSGLGEATARLLSTQGANLAPAPHGGRQLFLLSALIPRLGTQFKTPHTVG